MLKVFTALLSILFTLLFITVPVMAVDIDNNVLFPNVAQGHSCEVAGGTVSDNDDDDDDGQLEMDDDDTQINGGTAPLEFCSVKDLEGTCDGEACEVSKKANNKALKLDSSDIIFYPEVNAFKSFPSKKDNAYNLEAGDYQLNEVDREKASVTINANENVRIFVVDSFELDDVVLNINGNVDFFIKGDFDVDKSKININGQVRFFISGEKQGDDSEFDLDKSTITVAGKLEVYSIGDSEFDEATITKTNNSQFYFYGFGDVEIDGDDDNSTKTVINGYVYAGGELEIEDGAVINGRVTARRLEMEDGGIINDAAQGGDDNTPTPGPKCFVDDFERKNLKAEGDKKWVVKSKGENPFDPVIINNRFRLTEDDIKQSTAISYIGDKFPANNNKLVIEFDHYAYGGSGADGIALVLSDGDITPQPGAFGGPLGYGYRNKSNPGFAGGWLGIGIDEYGNFTNEGGSGSTGQHSHTVAIRGSGTGNSGFHLLKEANSTTSIDGYNKVCVKWDRCRRYEYQLRAHRYQITFDSTTAGKALITVKRNTNPDTSVSGRAESSFDEILINSFDVLNNDTQSDLPETLVFSITGSTGDLTNIHEIDRAKICANKTEEFNAKVDHFRFSFANNNAQACQAQNLTLTACDDSNCNNYFSQPVTVNLAEQDGMTWVGGSSVTFTGSTSLRLISTINEPVLDVIGSDPDTFPWSTTLCKVGTNNYSTNCKLNFSNALTKFELDFPNGNAAYAGEAFPVVLKPQQNCRPLFAGETHEISLSAKPVEPEQPALSPPVMLEYNNLDRSLAVNGPPETFKVTFNDAGEATFNLTYPEAGKTQLNVFEGDIKGSGQFVTVPKALCVSTESTGSGNDYKNYAPFKAAGADFDIKVSAHVSKSNTNYCDAPVLQNYVHPLFINSKLLAPADGVEGKLAVTTYTHGQAEDINNIKDGINTLTQSIDEVGVFELSVTPSDVAYHGTNLPIKSIPTTVGRFYPHRFILDSGEVESKNDGTDIESYMDQPFNINFIVSAVNKGGDITQNYMDGFAKAKVKLNALVDGNDDNNVNSRLSPTFNNPMTNWIGGQLSFPSGANSSEVEFPRNSDGKDGPYKLDFKLDFNDGEKAELSKLYDTRGVNADSSCNDENSGCNALLLGKQTVRYAQIKVPEQVLHPVNESASVPLQIQYWNSQKGTEGGWDDFSEDNWTTLSMTDKVSFPENIYDHPTLVVNGQVDVDAGLDQGTATGTGEKAVMEAGQVSLNVGAPGIASIIKYQLNLDSLPWLKPFGDAANEGQIKFGNSPGNRSVIYRREQ